MQTSWITRKNGQPSMLVVVDYTSHAASVSFTDAVTGEHIARHAAKVTIAKTIYTKRIMFVTVETLGGNERGESDRSIKDAVEAWASALIPTVRL